MSLVPGLVASELASIDTEPRPEPLSVIELNRPRDNTPARSNLQPGGTNKNSNSSSRLRWADESGVGPLEWERCVQGQPNNYGSRNATPEQSPRVLPAESPAKDPEPLEEPTKPISSPGDLLSEHELLSAFETHLARPTRTERRFLDGDEVERSSTDHHVVVDWEQKFIEEQERRVALERQLEEQSTKHNTNTLPATSPYKQTSRQNVHNRLYNEAMSPRQAPKSYGNLDEQERRPPARSPRGTPRYARGTFSRPSPSRWKPEPPRKWL